MYKKTRQQPEATEEGPTDVSQVTSEASRVRRKISLGTTAMQSEAATPGRAVNSGKYL